MTKFAYVCNTSKSQFVGRGGGTIYKRIIVFTSNQFNFGCAFYFAAQFCQNIQQPQISQFKR